MAVSGLKMAILAIFIAALLRFTAAQTTHTVGDALGWLVPPGGSSAYEVWAATQTFTVGDILVFKFSDGDQDVARVTKEAFYSCNSTNSISLQTKSPANFTLDNTGEYYFIGTKKYHCNYGQKLAIIVISHPGPASNPAPRSGPITYTVGEELGWFVPPGGPLFYAAWADDKTFEVGDTLVFNFIHKTTDVAVVNKTVYENCTAKNGGAATVYATSPASITLAAAGEHFFTSTYDHYCELGQKLAINVTRSSHAAAPHSPGGGGAKPPITSPSEPSTGLGPSAAPPPASLAPSRVPSGCYYFASLIIATLAFMY